MTEGRIAIIGDVHGHADELTHKLVRLGMDPDTHALPEDLTVIQVGDLIHRGQQSGDVLRMVDKIMTEQPGQWIQLIGNHEAQYLHQKLFVWDEELPDDEVAILQRWLDNGQIHAAACTVTPAGNEALVTHAGLVYDVWKIVLSRPRTASEAAARINAGLTHLTPWLWAPGEMLQGVPNRMVGPIWSSTAAELYPSWMNAEAISVPAPFSQVHGHSSAYLWGYNGRPGRVRRTELSLGPASQAADLRTRVIPDVERRHTKTSISGATFIGVDPGHGRSPAQQWEPLVYHGTASAPEPVTPPAMAWLTED